MYVCLYIRCVCLSTNLLVHKKQRQHKECRIDDPLSCVLQNNSFISDGSAANAFPVLFFQEQAQLLMLTDLSLSTRSHSVAVLTLCLSFCFVLEVNSVG
jgi:hypothetical protein